MYLMRFVSFVWGMYAGYKHSPLAVVLTVAISLVIGDIWLSRKQLFRNNGLNPKIYDLAAGITLYFGGALVVSLMAQGFGYLLGYFMRGAN